MYSDWRTLQMLLLLGYFRTLLHLLSQNRMHQHPALPTKIGQTRSGQMHSRVDQELNYFQKLTLTETVHRKQRWIVMVARR